MKEADLDFLKNQLDAFVGSSTRKMAHSGLTEGEYSVSVAEFKGATGRTRMSGELIQECENFFAKHGARADYDSETDSFDIKLDLNRIKMTGDQARAHTEAHDYYMQNYG